MRIERILSLKFTSVSLVPDTLSGLSQELSPLHVSGCVNRSCLEGLSFPSSAARESHPV